MAAQSLFSDFPSGVPGASPSITSDITQKSEEEDASTLAGYKKRLELQQQMEEDAARAHSEWSRQMSLQWKQEDLKKQAEQMMELDRQRKQAFDIIYAPTASQNVITQAQQANDRGQSYGSTSSTSPVAMQNINNKVGVYQSPDPSGASVIPGFGLVGGTWHVDNYGNRLPGPSPNDVQNLTNQAWQNQQLSQGTQNTNPYYRY